MVKRFKAQKKRYFYLFQTQHLDSDLVLKLDALKEKFLDFGIFAKTWHFTSFCRAYDLEHAFTIMNHGCDKNWSRMNVDVRSASVGDILVTSDDSYFIISNDGFFNITDAVHEYWQYSNTILEGSVLVDDTRIDDYTLIAFGLFINDVDEFTKQIFSECSERGVNYEN